MLRYSSLKLIAFTSITLMFFILPGNGECADTLLDGTLLSLIWGLPFVCLILSIAIWPLINPHFWEEHYGLITAVWSGIFLIALLFNFGIHITIQEVVGIIFSTYLPFVLLLVALYTVSGGIHLKGDLTGTPITNTFIIFLGTALASWIGTTGASMLFIRPLLRANIYRRYRVHSVIFFIILVANLGGALTPLGDPPIFLGFLAGVNFFWPTKHLLMPTLFVVSILLAIHFLIDSFLYKKEDQESLPKPVEGSKLSLEGWQVNAPLLLCIAGAVLMSGTWKPGIYIPLYGEVALPLQDLIRDIMLIAIVFISGHFTNLKIRERNAFNWDPMREVAKLFLGIFICLLPVLAILKAGEQGALSVIIELLNTNGQPNNVVYFWITGILSTFLDNAPTFLVFFNIAGGDAQVLMNTMGQTLLALTCGTVYMGANTYISNAPNLMVRSLATNLGVRMPSFFTYMFIIIGLLFPICGLFSYIWLR